MIATATTVQDVKIQNICMDSSMQMRGEISHLAVQDYADAMEVGDEFPPVIVYKSDNKLWLADGWHRVLAAKKIGRKVIRAEVRPGTRRDAILFAAGANARHGVRRTNADKQKVVTILLKDREWVKWTDTEIARRCGVSAQMVGRYRELLGREREHRVYIDRAGRLRSRTVESFSHKPQPQPQPRAVTCPHCQRTFLTP